MRRSPRSPTTASSCSRSWRPRARRTSASSTRSTSSPSAPVAQARGFTLTLRSAARSSSQTSFALGFAGIDLADSITIDFHKLWWQPFNASALVVRDAECFDLLRVKSNYLDRGDELEGMVNLVGRSLDTSRRFDAAKVVATLRAVGSRSLGEMLEHLVGLASYAGSLVESQPTLELVAPPSVGHVCLSSEGSER